jgi:O-acetylhomoserine (thiol)-lyase
MSDGEHRGPKGLGFDTLSLHAGQVPDPTTGARATPIYQSAAFVFPDSDVAVGLFNLERAGHVYSRLSNPTNAVLEERMAALDHGVGSIVTASGQAAIHLAITTLLSAGDHIVASRSLYGGTHNLFQYTLSRFGITTTFVDPRDFDAFTQAIQPNTKVIFGEVLGNPGLEVLDIPKLSKLAHDHGLPLMIDATFVTPYLCRPIDLGADIVVHSATKFLSGHGVVVGGVVVDGGTFDWRGREKFPTLSQPYEGFHDLVFAEEFGPLAFITRARREGIRDFGACMAPMTAFQILQGLETLPLRMQRHVENAEAIAKWLEQDPRVEAVTYAGLSSSPYFHRVAKICPKGAGALLTVSLEAGYDACMKLVSELNLFSHVANLGDTRSLVIHSASTTHRQLSPEQQTAAQAGPNVLRLSIGTEDVSDLIDDLDQALTKATSQS